MPPLELVADEVEDRWHWLWRLYDEDDLLLASQEVALDPTDWQVQAFTDLYRYTRQNTDPGRRTRSITRLVDQVGAWAGTHVLGKVVPACCEVELDRTFQGLELAWSCCANATRS